MPAFKSGMEVGADWLELDVHVTRDRKLVVIHDRTTQRVGDLNLVVAESTYQELLAVDVAADFRKRTGRNIDSCPRGQIPLLEEVLRLVMQQQRTRVSIQPKVDCVDAVMSLVDELEARRWVGFNDGNLNYMSRVKQLAADVPVFWDRSAATSLPADIKTAREHGFEALVIHFSGVTEKTVAELHAAGLQAGVWTVSDAAMLRKFWAMGVDRIYTDAPSVLLEVQENSRQ